MELTYDSSILEIVSISPGTLLRGNGLVQQEGGYSYQSDVDDSAGTATINMALLAPASAVTQAGQIAEIKVKCKEPGEGSISLTEVTLLGPTGVSIPSIPMDGAVTCRVLTRSASPGLNGRVTSSVGGGSVSRARISFDGTGAGGAPEYQAVSGLFGFFDLDEISPGTYQVTVTHPGYLAFQDDFTFSSTENATLDIKLTPAGDESLFDVTFSVIGVVSQINLAGADVKIERFNSSAGQTVLETVHITTEDGIAEALDLRQGFYAFTVSKDGWDTKRWPEANGAQRLSQSHLASVALKPQTGTLVVDVKGISVLGDEEQVTPANSTSTTTGEEDSPIPYVAGISPLTGVMAEIIGLDFAGNEVLPARAVLTGQDGLAIFSNLPQINWELRVERLGYKPFSLSVPISGTGITPISVQLELLETELNVGIKTPFTTVDFRYTRPVQFLIEGINGSNTEGIKRTRSMTPGHLFCPDDQENSLCPETVTIDRLLPGRYWVKVSRDPAGEEKTEGLADTVRYWPYETFIDLAPSEKQKLVVRLQPVPAKVHVELLVFDEAAVSGSSYGDPRTTYLPIEQTGLIFEEGSSGFKVISYETPPPQFDPGAVFELGEPVYNFDTDSDGRFTAELPPGAYSVRIPTMTGYTGHSVDYAGVIPGEDGGAPETVQVGPVAWPAADECPTFVDQLGHTQRHDCNPLGVGSLVFQSGGEYHVTLRVHKQQVSISGLVIPDVEDDPTTTTKMVAGIGHGNFVTVRNITDLVHLGGGQATISAEGIDPVPLVTAGNRWKFGEINNIDNQLWRRYALKDKVARYQFTGVPPGTYTITATHPRMTFSEVQVTVPAWQTPGSAEPMPAGEGFFGGANMWPGHMGLVNDVVVASYVPGRSASGSVTCFYWIQPTNPSTGEKEGDPRYEERGCPNIIYESSYGGYWYNSDVPGLINAWVRCPDFWYRGSLPFSVNLNGPQGVCKGAGTAAPFEKYRLDIETVLEADLSHEVTGVTVRVGRDFVESGDTIEDFSDHPKVRGVQTDGWSLSNKRPPPEILSYDPLTLRLTIILVRDMDVTGTVKDESGNELATPSVKIFSRFGDLVATDDNGEKAAFDVTVPAQVGFAEVTVPGFVPRRIRLEPSAKESNVGPLEVDLSDVKMKRLNAPRIDSFTLNRYGLFLPGVLRSGDSSFLGYDPENAREALTAIWEARVINGQNNYTINAFDEVDGSLGGEIPWTDKINEVWLLDTRAFITPPINADNQAQVRQIGLLDCITSDPCLVDSAKALELLEAVKNSSKDGEAFNVLYSIGAPADGSDTNENYQSTLNIWELPVGEFRPILLAVTEGGAVSKLDYELPPAQKPLHGVALPPFMAYILDTIGVASNYLPTATGLGLPKGRFLPLPAFEGGIQFTPLGGSSVSGISAVEELDTEQEGYLDYKYKVAVDWVEGVRAPKSGALSTAPSQLGFGYKGNPTTPVKGASVEIAVNGQKGTITVAGGAALSSDMFEEEGNKDKELYQPDLVKQVPRSRVFIKTPEVAGEASISGTYTVDPGDLRIPTFELKLSGGAEVSTQILVDISDGVAKIVGIMPPPGVGAVIGAAIQGLAATDALTFNVVTDFRTGGSISKTLCTEIPRPQIRPGTVTSEGIPSNPAAWGLLGGYGCPPDSDLTKTEIFLDLGVGLAAVSGPRDRSYFKLAGTIAFGPPSTQGGGKGVVFTLNPKEVWPPVTNIKGAISGRLAVSADIWVAVVSKKWQWDLYRFDWQFGTEPYFDLIPLSVSDELILPSMGSSAVFDADSARLVEGFYQAGAMDLTETGPAALLFTDISGETGEMTLKSATAEGNGWGTPVQIAAAPGIVDASITAIPGGGWMAVWSEIIAEDIGNPYPSSTVKYSISGPSGLEWSPPEILTQDTGVAHQIQSARAGNDVVLTYTATGSGPTSGEGTIYGADWSGSEWNGPYQLVADQKVKDVELAGNTRTSGTLAALAVTDSSGTVQLFTWNGSVWVDKQTTTLDTGQPISLAIDARGRLVMAENGSDGSMKLWLISTGDRPTLLGQIASGVLAQDILMTTTDDGQEFFVTWTEGTNSQSVFYTLVDGDGEPSGQPRNLTPVSPGNLRSLQAHTFPDGTVNIVVVSEGESVGIDQLRVTAR